MDEPGCELTALDESRRSAAFKRYRVLKPFLVGEVSLPVIADESGVPLRSLRRWVSRYREKGLAGLARRSADWKSRFLQYDRTKAFL